MRRFLTVLLLLSSHSHACFTPPDRYYLNPDRMFTHSDGVILAKVVSVVKTEAAPPPNAPTKFAFKTLQFYENPYARELQEHYDFDFTMDGYPPADGKSTDYSAHEDLKFWGDSLEGNSVLRGDCNALGVFEVGKVYLLFLNLSHPKGSELIEKDGDRWHELVKHIAKRYARTPDTKPVAKRIDVDSLARAPAQTLDEFCKTYCAEELQWSAGEFTKSSIQNFFQTREEIDVRCDYSEVNRDIGGDERHSGSWIVNQCSSRNAENCYWSINYGKPYGERVACIRPVFILKE